MSPLPPGSHQPSAEPSHTASPASPGGYVESQIQALLAEDPRTAEQSITTVQHGDTLVLCGEVESTERRRQIERVVAERFPDIRFDNDIAITRAAEPDSAEDLQ